MNVMVYHGALLEFDMLVTRCELVEYKDVVYELMDRIKMVSDLEQLHLSENNVSLLRSALLFVVHEFCGYEGALQTKTGYEMEQFHKALKCLPESNIIWDDED